MLRENFRKLKTCSFFAIFVTVLMSACLVAGLATAQEKGQGKDQAQQMQNVRKKMKNNRSKLKQIQQEVMQDNPDLQKRGQELQKMQRRKMMEYAGKNATREERFQALMKVRQDEEVQEKMGQFREDLVEKMQQENPKTEQYIQEMQSAAQEMRSLNQQRSPQGGARTVQ